MTSPPPIVDERAWQAQERALRAAHGRADGPDAIAATDRRLAQALREPPLSPLPADFAAEVARLAEPACAVRPADTRFERLLGAGLGVTLAAAALMQGLAQGAEWLRIVADQAAPLPPGALRLGIALAACVGCSWLIGLLPRGPLRQ